MVSGSLEFNLFGFSTSDRRVLRIDEVEKTFQLRNIHRSRWLYGIF
jgi:hypothetical protein